MWGHLKQIPEEDEEIDDDEDEDDEEESKKKEDLDTGAKMFTKTQILKLHGSLSKEDLGNCRKLPQDLVSTNISIFRWFIHVHPNFRCFCHFKNIYPAYPSESLVVSEERAGYIADFLKVPGGVLLASDAASRGLDFPRIDWIIQYDPPQRTDLSELGEDMIHFMDPFYGS
jgi:hypothetical protein